MLSINWPALLVVLCGSVTVIECAVSVSTAKSDEKINATISIDCTVTGDALDGWYFKGRKISSQVSDRVHVTSSGDTHTLKIKKIHSGDGGQWECLGQKGDKATFLLWIHATFIEPIAKKQYISLFKTDVVKVKILGYPKPKVTWKNLKDNKELSFASNSRYELLSDGSLRIKNVKREDTGTYTVRYNQENLRSTSLTIEVTVTLPPTIFVSPHPEKRYVTEGQNISFICKIDGESKPTIKWLDPNASEVNSLSNPRYHIAADNQAFYIYNIQQSDKGIWTCMGSVGKLKVNATVEIVDVYDKPKINTVSSSSNANSCNGNIVTLRCLIASGRPYPTITWYKPNGERITSNVSSITNGSEVTVVTGQDTGDYGRYTCIATNDGGSDKHNITVIRKCSRAVDGQQKESSGAAVNVLSGFLAVSILINIIFALYIYKMRKQLNTEPGDPPDRPIYENAEAIRMANTASPTEYEPAEYADVQPNRQPGHHQQPTVQHGGERIYQNRSGMCM